MKKIFLMTTLIILLLTCNVIYARQTNNSLKVCDVENCTQTRRHSHNTCETNQCYIEECTNTPKYTHNNCGNRGVSVNRQHHIKSHHECQ